VRPKLKIIVSLVYTTIFLVLVLTGSLRIQAAECDYIALGKQGALEHFSGRVGTNSMGRSHTICSGVETGN
jgi:hypothetical protein